MSKSRPKSPFWPGLILPWNSYNLTLDLPLTSYFFSFFHFFLTFPLSAPPSTGGSFSFFFPGRLSAFLFFCLFLLFSFIYNSFQASFLFSFENQERRKKDFSASFQFLFSSGWKEREKKSREGQGLCPVPSAFERRKGCVLFSVGWWKWCCLDGNINTGIIHISFINHSKKCYTMNMISSSFLFIL